MDLSKLLGALRNPVRKHLQSELERMEYDPYELEAVIERAIESANEVAKNRQDQMAVPHLLISYIVELALDYLLGVLGQDKKINELNQLINAYKSIFVVGAGISFETGVPLSLHLNRILKFCETSSYEQLRESVEKSCKFKQQFKQVCDIKNPGPSHQSICRAFPIKINDIICLNWDNLIERAAMKLGIVIPKINEDIASTLKLNGYLWKFHGDVDNIKTKNVKGEGGWIFPDEGGYIFKHFRDYVNRLKNCMFVVVIVGYSQKDKAVNDTIKLLERKPPRPTFKIGLDLKHLNEDDYIVGPSDYILPRILR